MTGSADAPVVAVLPPLTSSAPKRPEWLNAIKALRRDAREQPESGGLSQGASTAPFMSAPEMPAPALEARAQSRSETAQPGASGVMPSAPSSPATLDAHQGETLIQEAGPATPSRSKRRRLARKARKENAVQADWGFIDPDENGFSALVTRLDELTDHK